MLNIRRSLFIGVAIIAALSLTTFVVCSAKNNEVDMGSGADQEIIFEQSQESYEPADTPEVSDITSDDSNTAVMYYTEDEVLMVAKLLYRECRGVASDTEKACVAWTVCNRVDSDDFCCSTITEALLHPNAFAYNPDTPVWDDLYELAEDVLSRWNRERNGELSVGRVLPADYTYFHGDGKHNYFRNAYKGDFDVWNYSAVSPYED